VPQAEERCPQNADNSGGEVSDRDQSRFDRGSPSSYRASAPANRCSLPCLLIPRSPLLGSRSVVVRSAIPGCSCTFSSVRSKFQTQRRWDICQHTSLRVRPLRR